VYGNDVVPAANLFTSFWEPIVTVWRFSPDMQPVTNFAQERLQNQSGFLMPGPQPAGRYLMRAFKTTVTTGHVYWETFDDPDPLAVHAPYPASVLTDIVLVAELC
jgi:hypothetical protein